MLPAVAPALKGVKWSGRESSVVTRPAFEKLLSGKSTERVRTLMTDYSVITFYKKITLVTM